MLRHRMTIRELREFAGLTQKEFADVLGMSVYTYAYKEKSNRFYFSEVYMICDKVGVDIYDINPIEFRKE